MGQLARISDARIVRLLETRLGKDHALVVEMARRLRVSREIQQTYCPAYIAALGQDDEQVISASFRAQLLEQAEEIKRAVFDE